MALLRDQQFIKDVTALPTLAETLRDRSLRETEVWLVATGCEEVGCAGAIAFFNAHRNELRDAAVIVVDTVGGPASGPCYFRSEGMVLQHKYDPELLALADAVVAHAAIGDREGDALVRGAIAAVEEQMLPHGLLVRLQEAVLAPPGMTRHRWRIAAITQSLLAAAA